MKIYWFSFIYMIVNCSVQSVVAATYTRFRQAWPYSAVGFGDVWSAASQWSVPQWSRLSGVALWAVITLQTLKGSINN